MRGVTIALLLCCLYSVDCSHFRGGYITWKPAGQNKIDISYRVAFRRSYSNNHYCDDSIIDNGGLVNGEGSLQCFSGCSGSITSMSYYCTDFSVAEDWSTGIRRVTYTLPSTTNKTFEIGYQSCCWIPLVTGGSGWRLFTDVDTNIRTDTGKINSSPVTAMQPIVRFIQGCNYRLRIPVADDDKDTVRCRWALSAKDECGGVCQALPGSNLDENGCTLQYNATGSPGWYAVALQIEDFKSTSDTEPLSSIPLQFMVHISAKDSCTSGPVLPTSNTLQDGTTKQVASGSTLEETLVAQSSSTKTKITEINTISPKGTKKSEVYRYGTSGVEYAVNVTWTPTPDQAGSHIICYSAVDESGQTSNQTCSTLVVDGEPEETTVMQTTEGTTQPIVETTIPTTEATTVPTTTPQAFDKAGNIRLDDSCSTVLDSKAIRTVCASALTQRKFYFPTSCPSNFLQCSTVGTGYILSCPPGLEWCPSFLTCTWSSSCV